MTSCLLGLGPLSKAILLVSFILLLSANCQVIQTGVLECYQCLMYEGIQIQECLYPKARHLRAIGCGGTPGPGTGGKDRRRCIKSVFFSTSQLEGQVIKAWTMRRDCLHPLASVDFWGQEFACGVCYTSPHRFKSHKRKVLLDFGFLPKTYTPEEEVIEHASICTCCQNECNAEEGFNLSRLHTDEKASSSSYRNAQLPGLLAITFLELVSNK